MTTPFSSPFSSPFGSPFSLPYQDTGLIIDATLQAYIDYVDGEGGDIGDLNAMVTTYNQLKAWGVLGKIAFLTNLDWGRSYTGLDLSGLISFVRTTAALNTAFEPLFYFSAGPSPPAKRGQIFISETLANFGVGNADALVAMGYHVGFLNDSADAAHKYAVPNDSLRAALRGLGLDTVQKMIDRTTTVDVSNQTPKLEGTIEGSSLFVGITGNLYLYTNQLSGSIPAELGNLSKLIWLYLHANELSGSIPPELGNLSELTRLYLHANELSGSIPPELGNLSKLTLLWLYTNQLSGWPDITVPGTWNDVLMQTNEFTQASVDTCLVNFGDSYTATPRTGTLNISGASMATPTWGTAAAPSDVAYAQRVLTYPGRWTVTVQGAVDALVADLLPDLDYKYPLTEQYSVAGSDFATGDVKLATRDGEAMFWIEGVDMSAYAVGTDEHVIAFYDNDGYGAFAFAKDVGDGEDWDATELVTSWDDVNLTTWDVTGTDINQAAGPAGSRAMQSVSDVGGRLYKAVSSITINSGGPVHIVFTTDDGGGVTYFSTKSTTGAVAAYHTGHSDHVQYRYWLRAVEGDFAATGNSLKKVIDVPATGLRLVNTTGGATRNMIWQDASFDPNDIRKVNVHKVV